MRSMQAATTSWPAKHNWRYIARESPPKREAGERICDFDEIYSVRAVRDSRMAAAGIHKYLSSGTGFERVVPLEQMLEPGVTTA